MILITHGHQDHTAVNLIKNRNDSCQVITWEEALVNGEYKTFDLGFATVEAVRAGNNKNHNIRECVGWLITLSDGVTVYATGDTSTLARTAKQPAMSMKSAFRTHRVLTERLNGSRVRSRPVQVNQSAKRITGGPFNGQYGGL